MLKALPRLRELPLSLHLLIPNRLFRFGEEAPINIHGGELSWRGVLEMGHKGTVGACPRRRDWAQTAYLSNRTYPGIDSHRGRLDISLDTCDLPRHKQSHMLSHFQAGCQHLRRIDVCVPVDDAESDELGIFEPWDHSEHPFLFTPFETVLACNK